VAATERSPRVPTHGGSAGDPNALYFAAGIGHESHGLFGSIRDVPAPPSVFGFSSPTYAAGENAGPVIITVNRTGDASAAATVQVSRIPASEIGSAAPGPLYREGTALMPIAYTTNSYERKPGGLGGSTQDTGNDANDFHVRPMTIRRIWPAPAPPGARQRARSCSASCGWPEPTTRINSWSCTTTAVDISGWLFRESTGGSNAPEIITRLTFSPGTIIPACGHFLEHVR
jgi:hypothetical protein